MLIFKPFKSFGLWGLLSLSIAIFTSLFINKLRGENPISEFIEELGNLGKEKEIGRPKRENSLRIISELSLEEKVGQLFHIAIEGTELEENKQKLIERYKVGGIILFAENLKNSFQIRKLNEDLQRQSIRSSAIPLFISTDQEWGKVNRLGPEASTPFPSAMALGQTAKPIYVEEAAFITAYELRQLGLNWVLAPVLDINNNPKNPVINIRSFGSNPKLVTQMGKAYIRGNRRALSLSAIKHFPGHGDTDVDSHLALPRINKSLEEMKKTELLPFQSAIQDKDAKAEALMTAHILFPLLDSEKPASLSPRILKKILRRDLGFKGLVITDAMEMKAISQRYTPQRAARLAFQAGVDIILLGERGKGNRRLHAMYKGLLEDFRKKRLGHKELDRAIERQLSLKMRRGLFHRWGSPYRNKSKESQSYWEKQEKRVQNHYKRIIRKYDRMGINLNTLISRDSITAMHKSFRGLSLKEFNRVRLLVQSESMRKQALQMGIAPQHIYKLYKNADILRIPMQAKFNGGEIWLLELRAASLGFWNRLAKRQKKEKRRDISLIGLYTGNPFLPLEAPKKGAVLSSCSNTEASKRALIYRVLYPGKIIPKTNLILTKMPSTSY